MIALEKLCVRLGSFALEEISFEIPSGRYGVLMGRTGCGKTTLLEAICGLRGIQGGRIRLMNVEVTTLSPAGRGIGYVPQDGALFSTMTVSQNLAFALAVRKWPAEDQERRIKELAELLGLQSLLHRKPAGLSGGEAQRVALGRALAAHPKILCLDEPLSALDEETRAEMGSLLRRVSEQTGVTTLHVTHHQDEARKLGDIIIRLKEGRITHEQQDRAARRGGKDSAEAASESGSAAEPGRTGRRDL